MYSDKDKLQYWLGIKIDAGSILTLLTGEIYYSAYFEYFSILRDDVQIPLYAHFKISIVIAFLIFLIALVYYSRFHEPTVFRSPLLGNIPLFIIIFFVTIVGVYIYWANINSISSWLSSLHSRQKFSNYSIMQLTTLVESYLRWVILLAPILVSTTLVIWLSLRKISFSYFFNEPQNSSSFSPLRSVYSFISYHCKYMWKNY